MRVAVGLVLLVASALAYPVAESESKTPDVPPLVITDYSSVSKAEDQVAHDIPHGKPGHVHDSAESSSSESSENKSAETQKPKEKSSESSEEGIMQDGLPLSTLKPAEEKKEIKPELPKKEEAVLKSDALKPEEIKKEELPKEIKEEKKEISTPLLKSLLAEEAAKPAEKIEKKEEAISTPAPIPPVKSEPEPLKPIQAEPEEKPLALPALKYDLKAEPAKAEVAQPSEIKVEASPVAEEIAPKLKSAEPIKEKEEPKEKEIKTEKIEEPKIEKIEEPKPTEASKAKTLEEEKKTEIIKPEDKKPEETKMTETKKEEIKEKIDELKSIEIPLSKPEETKNNLSEEKKPIESAQSKPIAPAVNALPPAEEKVKEQKPAPKSDAIVPEAKNIDPKPEKQDTKTNLGEPQKAEESKKPEETKPAAEKLPSPSASSS